MASKFKSYLGIVVFYVFFCAHHHQCDSVYHVPTQRTQQNLQELSFQPRARRQTTNEQFDFRQNFDYSGLTGLAPQQNPHPSTVARETNNLPLYKQSYPGLYNRGDLKTYGFEPTMRVNNGNSHHGKDGHKFLVQSNPIEASVFQGFAHSISNHEDHLI